MNTKIILGLLISAMFLAGCLTGEIRHNIKADGSDDVELELDKSGMLANVDCTALKQNLTEMAEASPEGTDEVEIQNIKDMDCTDTEDAMIFSDSVAVDENESKVTIVERDGKEYLRFEDKENPFLDTVVIMPSPVTDHNGKAVDDKTIEFKAAGMPADGTYDDIYVESEKPACPLSMIVLAGLLLAGFVVKR